VTGDESGEWTEKNGLACARIDESAVKDRDEAD